MNESIANKFDRLFTIFAEIDFLEGKRLGGEIASYITTYNPQDHNSVTEQILALKNRLEKNGRIVLLIDIYQTMIQILQEKRLFDKILASESAMKKQNLFSSLVSALNIQSVLIPQMEKMLAETSASIVFLIGIGQVFPIIRAHSVLNNIQNLVAKIPVVTFFPGTYDGVSLKLFNSLQDQHHYRAFNLDTPL